MINTSTNLISFQNHYNYSKDKQFENEIVVLQPKVKYNKDGSVKKTHSNKIKGKDSEVFAFKTKEEISLMLSVFDKHIQDASTELRRKIAWRNKLLFLIGINVGVRGSDLCQLKWKDFFYDNMEFKDTYRFQPQKTKNQGKFVRLYYNNTVKGVISEYVKQFPIDDLEDYIFFSQKEPYISRMSAGRIIKDAADECDLKQNINSHSFRKTWAYHVWHEAEDKQKALVLLQFCFNHSSTVTTMKYIGILDDDIKEVYNGIELGFDSI